MHRPLPTTISCITSTSSSHPNHGQIGNIKNQGGAGWFMREKGCAEWSMWGKKAGPIHADLPWTWRAQRQDCSVYSSQYLQITFTPGVIPVPPWLFLAYKTLYLGSRSVNVLVTGSSSPPYVLRRGRVSTCSSSTLVHCHEWPFMDHCLLCRDHHPQNHSPRPRKIAVHGLLLLRKYSLIHHQCRNRSYPVVQEHRLQHTAYSTLISHVEIFSRLCISAHWSLVTGVVECSRIYHVLSNLLGMLRSSFMALSSKQYFLDFFKDAHVPMPDISGYIRERVKSTVQQFALNRSVCYRYMEGE